jgi:hypothetical protein
MHVSGLAAAPLFWVWLFCSRGSLTPVAAPNVSPNDFFVGTFMDSWPEHENF